jgi:hypothetical protein
VVTFWHFGDLFLIKENIMSQIPVSWKKIAKKRKEI